MDDSEQNLDTTETTIGNNSNTDVKSLWLYYDNSDYEVKLFIILYNKQYKQI
jgi:hypothetical protein